MRNLPTRPFLQSRLTSIFVCQQAVETTFFVKPPMDELIPTRATLIQRLKNWQDQSSWQDFFDTYWKLIYHVALKGGLSEAEAEDVVQETMISVARHMPTFKYDPAIGSFKAWLLNMTRWRITDQLRQRGPAAECSSPASRRVKKRCSCLRSSWLTLCGP